ncbi:MAG: lysophospholipid acyltransferase family protein [Phycisphaerales bacterium]
MGDAFYRFVRFVGRPVFWLSAMPVVLGVEHVPRAAGRRTGPDCPGSAGACILASTHESAYDVALLIAHTPRLLDFVSIVEVFRNPILAWFYGSLNAFPLDRTRPDSKTVRIILGRLSRGRMVGMFPEGGLRSGDESVVSTRRIRPGIGRIAALSRSCVVPCVIVDSAAYRRPRSWLPLFRSRYGIIYGEPLRPEVLGDRLEAALVEALVALHTTLLAAMDRTGMGLKPAEPSPRTPATPGGSGSASAAAGPRPARR